MANVKRKRGASGASSLYCTRNQALARLQLRLPDFRRLCILKGVHPREPRRKTAGQNKTYYHVKDIAFLAHEPLLVAFRAARAHRRKVRRALAKGHATGAARLVAAAPRYSLDHLVRERYPAFADALRDVDDPLTMVHLFASLPAERAHGIPAERVQTARRCVLRRAPRDCGASVARATRLTLLRLGRRLAFRLSLEFQAYVALTGGLRKAFISVKGIYFQVPAPRQCRVWTAARVPAARG
jgi:pescadillo protein